MTKVTSLQVFPYYLLGFFPAFRVDEVVTHDGGFHSAKQIAIFLDADRASSYAQSIPALTEEI